MAEHEAAQARVIKLDRGFPLVKVEEGPLAGTELRCEHATALVKETGLRATIGDIVHVEIPAGHDMGIIVDIAPRTTSFVRRDPTERTMAQTLAANFDLVIIAEPIDQLSLNRLERELVLAHDTNADVAVVLTKTDLAGSAEEAESVCGKVRALARRDVSVLPISAHDAASTDALRALLQPSKVAVLIGKSGVGKSSLVNVLVGEEVQATGNVRMRDGRGRHTTVSREIVPVPSGGYIVDMPGVRGLGLWDAEEGLARAFSDVEELAAQCRFRDCNHTDEPGCAVRAAVSAGELAQARLDSYLVLRNELRENERRREEERRLRGEKASDRKEAQRTSAERAPLRKKRPAARRKR